jgi:hypothetical protein
MNNKTECPCAGCISLAICYHLKPIYCSILYEFICILTPNGGFDGYKDDPNVSKSVFDVYKKYITATRCENDSISLHDCKDFIGYNHAQRLIMYRLNLDRSIGTISKEEYERKLSM